MAYNPSANIVISGKTFMDVPSVQFKTPNGATVNFAHVGGSIRFSPTLEEQTNNVENFSNAIIDPITSTLLNQLDSDFVAENIKKDVDLFGLVGTLEAGGTSNNIVAGSFTLSESLTTSSPLYIDVTFPKNERPLMYCVYEDTSNLDFLDTSHTATRLRFVVAARTKDDEYDYFYVISAYNNSGQFSMNYVGDNIVYRTDDYEYIGGIYGTMNISLIAKQIRFKAIEDGKPFLGGRTYNYILYWGD